LFFAELTGIAFADDEDNLIVEVDSFFFQPADGQVRSEIDAFTCELTVA
jgi:hypothetical protein